MPKAGIPWMTALLAGGAVVLLSLLSSAFPLLGMFLNYFTVLPLFLVSLSLGMNAGIFAALAAFLGIFLMIGAYQAAGFLAITCLPFLLLSYFALQTKSSSSAVVFSYPLGVVLSKTTLSVGAVVLALFILLEGAGVDIRASIYHFLDSLIANELVPEKARILNQLVDIFPGIIVLSCLSTAILNALMAQKILIQKKLALRQPQPDDLSFDGFWDIVVTAALMMIISGSIFDSSSLSLLGKTVALLGAVPLGFAGFRVFYLRFFKDRFKAISFGVLVLLTFLLVWPLLFIVLLGFIEPWYGLAQPGAVKK